MSAELFFLYIYCAGIIVNLFILFCMIIGIDYENKSIRIEDCTLLPVLSLFLVLLSFITTLGFSFYIKDTQHPQDRVWINRAKSRIVITLPFLPVVLLLGLFFVE